MTTRSVHRWRRRALPGIALPVLAAGLAGCIKMDLDLAIADQTVSGPMVIALSRDALEYAQQFDESADPDQLLSDMEAEFDESVEGVTTEPYEDDTFVGTRYVFDRVPLEELNAAFSEDGDPDALRIVYHADSDTYEVTGAMDLSDADGDLALDDESFPPGVLDAMMGAFEMKIALTFPGEVLETTGEVSGSTVTWTPTVGERTELRAVARGSGSGTGGDPGAGPAAGDDEAGLPGTTPTSGNSTSTLTAVLVGLGALLVIGAVAGAILLMRRRGEPAVAADAPTETGADVPAQAGPPADPTPTVPDVNEAPTATLPDGGQSPPSSDAGEPPRP